MHIRYTVHFYGKYNVYDSMYECSGKKVMYCICMFIIIFKEAICCRKEKLQYWDMVIIYYK